MATFPAASRCRSLGGPISPRDSEVVHHQRCARGAHVVIIGTTGLGSMVMRGQLTHSVLQQTMARHGANSSYIMVTQPVNDSSPAARYYSDKLERHFDQVGGPSVCVLIKYSVAWMGAACRRRGAIVLVDSIDNHRAFNRRDLGNEHYDAMDAIIVQTQKHAAWLAEQGHTALVVPHPHGNLGAWSVASHVRPTIRGVGFVASDAKNMPTQSDLRMIVRACCRFNATLYIVGTGGAAFRFKQQNCTEEDLMAAAENRHWAEEGRSPCAASGPHGNQHPGRATAVRFGTSGGPLMSNFGAEALAQLRDETGQRKYYESTRLLELIDVGVLWRPGRQQGSAFAIRNRPPTRMHWWWSHGIPVIGYPMEAYLDAGRRVSYPESLLNLTTSEEIEEALRRIAQPQERACLQAPSLQGAMLSSPLYSSSELLVAICALAERCGALDEPRPEELRQPVGQWARRIATRHRARGAGQRADANPAWSMSMGVS